jgi:MarR family transcriptional regulator for hemolysin
MSNDLCSIYCGDVDPPIGRQLHYVAHRAQQAFNSALVKAGGTLPMWLTLLAIKKHGAQTQSALASKIGFSGATLSHHLDGLEQDGLVTRSRNAEDRRSIQVELTAAGEERFDLLHAAALDYEHQLLEGATKDELAVFEKVLHRFASNLGRVSDPDRE